MNSKTTLLRFLLATAFAMTANHFVRAQQPPVEKRQAQPKQRGMSTDAPEAPIKDGLSRPIMWLTLKLVRGPGSPRDAIGAKVFVTTGGVRQRGDVSRGGRYANSSDQRVHFGLGSAARIDKLEIVWLGGKKREPPVPALDPLLTVVEGKGIEP
jgi:hypothetical protein